MKRVGLCLSRVLVAPLARRNSPSALAAVYSGRRLAVSSNRGETEGVGLWQSHRHNKHHHPSFPVNVPKHCHLGEEAERSSTENKQVKPRLVVFDKYGTLISFQTTWVPWIQALKERLQKHTGLVLEDKINQKLNICVFTQKVRSGVLAEGTSFQIKRHLEDLLVEEGLSKQDAHSAVETCWVDCDTSNADTIKQLADLKELFVRLHSAGIKIAIFTSDIRNATERTLGKLDLLSHIDKLLCGDDPDRHSAPGMHSEGDIHDICKELGVCPSETVVIGDTEGDVCMGRKAGAAMTIGVLSGIGNRLELAPHSNYVVDDVKEAVRLVMDGHETPHTDLTPHVSVCPQTKASLVIFDKDGTLLCFHSLWTPWAKSLVTRLEEATGLPLFHKLMETLGFDHSSQMWTPGILAEGTTGQNKERIKQLLQVEGLSQGDAHEAVNKAWVDGDHSDKNKNLKPVDNPTNLFKTLKENGVKVAVCTADCRVATEQFLQSLGASQYVDLLVCGDDEGTQPKPAAYNALHICKELGVHPASAVVVGDTIADLGMGRRAKLGATVAVLTGVGRPHDLDSQADHVVPSIKHVLPLVLRNYTPEKASIRKYQTDTTRT